MRILEIIDLVGQLTYFFRTIFTSVLFCTVTIVVHHISTFLDASSFISTWILNARIIKQTCVATKTVLITFATTKKNYNYKICIHTKPIQVPHFWRVLHFLLSYWALSSRNFFFFQKSQIQKHLLVRSAGIYTESTSPTVNISYFTFVNVSFTWSLRNSLTFILTLG